MNLSTAFDVSVMIFNYLKVCNTLIWFEWMSIITLFNCISNVSPSIKVQFTSHSLNNNRINSPELMTLKTKTTQMKFQCTPYFNVVIFYDMPNCRLNNATLFSIQCGHIWYSLKRFYSIYSVTKYRQRWRNDAWMPKEPRK